MIDEFHNHKEPDETFLPLSEEEYTLFYSIEMENFVDDITFYHKHCGKGRRLLELGCGEGRISRALTKSGRCTVGLDLSFSMLQKAYAQRHNPPFFLCMDMMEMAFSCQFDHIILPYNTLNLLRDRVAITSCLQQIHVLLSPGGSLLLQVYATNQQLLTSGNEKQFQFQMFSLPDSGGKLIKETLRSYDPHTESILLEERYRVRPTPGQGIKRDLAHTLYLASFSQKEWLSILENAGFTSLSLFGDYESNPLKDHTSPLLLIKAEKNKKDNKSPIT